ncbi:MAG TPA: alpha/beta family hydrolase [Candidatus Polarisedimenticolia bacterium]|nr:alpha/beta family hydrolase [Candidatus Polarisedimenticolia bacterium]
MTADRNLQIDLGNGQSVSALLRMPDKSLACLVLAHGAGAGMAHPFLESVAASLAGRGVATLRYQFPYMERGSKRPDPPKLAQATVRAAAAAARRLAPGLPLFAGGKSFGGRMTSQAQAESPLAGVRGLVFLGFPLHPPGRSSDERGKHLLDVLVPMLFLQGTRDDFASLSLLQPLLQRLGSRATPELVEGADHSFRVPARAGVTSEQVLVRMMERLVAWVEETVGGSNPGTS